MRNATLSEVREPDLLPDYDQPAQPGAQKWSGSERVYWSERLERVQAANTTDVIEARSLVVSDTLVVPWSIGDRVTVTRDGSVAESGTVRKITVTSAPGLPGVVRLALEDA